MRRPPDPPREPSGAWDRKKARTRAAIQQHALRLFGEQGYHVTTFEQIAAAADLAPSTVYRYFPAKHDLLVLEDHHSILAPLAESFEAQPPDATPIQALRGAIRHAFASLSPADRAARYERDRLVLVIPEVWAANLGLVARGRELLRTLLAGHTGSSPDDPALRALTDAVYGVGLGVLLDWPAILDQGGDPATALDTALANLERAFPSRG